MSVQYVACWAFEGTASAMPRVLHRHGFLRPEVCFKCREAPGKAQLCLGASFCKVRSTATRPTPETPESPNSRTPEESEWLHVETTSTTTWSGSRAPHAAASTPSPS